MNRRPLAVALLGQARLIEQGNGLPRGQVAGHAFGERVQGQ
jgi:hypothetical protein